MRTPTRHRDTQWVPLVAIRTRGRVNVATVEEYRRLLEQGHEAPPIRLARSGEWFVVRDGRHRVAAAAAAGFELIEAELYERQRPAATLLQGLRRLWHGVRGGGRRPLPGGQPTGPRYGPAVPSTGRAAEVAAGWLRRSPSSPSPTERE